MIRDIVRMLVVSILGAVLVFLVQPGLYQSDIIALTDVEVSDWVAEKYMPGAAIVFGTALGATVLWYVVALRSKVTAFKEASSMRLWWAAIFIIPVLGICSALYFFNDSNDAVLSLAIFFVIDSLIVFWFSTAIASPGLLKFVPPGSFTVRHMIGLK